MVSSLYTLKLPKSPAASRVQQGTVFWDMELIHTQKFRDRILLLATPAALDGIQAPSSIKNLHILLLFPVIPSSLPHSGASQPELCPVGLKENRDFSRLGGGHSPDAPKIGMGQEFGYKTSHFCLMG